jgi:hypothetical protein
MLCFAVAGPVAARLHVGGFPVHFPISGVLGEIAPKHFMKTLYFVAKSRFLGDVRALWR